MSRKNDDGESLNFSDDIRRQAFVRNEATAPRGCVGYWCEWCFFSNVKQEYFDIDHLIPVARRADFGISDEELLSIRNACVLCKGCNESKNQYSYPRHGVGFAFRRPNLNMTWGERRHQPLSWDEMVLMAQRKPPFTRPL